MQYARCGTSWPQTAHEGPNSVHRTAVTCVFLRVADADNRAELAASRARVVASADDGQADPPNLKGAAQMRE
jgi:hypothetical protein